MKDIELLRKILDCIDKIQSYTEGTDYETFQQNTMMVEACVFNLSQIGEHCHSITDEYKELHPELPWHEMYGLRNRIVHNYEGVNLKLVWEIISADLSELREQILSLL
ncbi:MAG: DUF86 domain-containing protein [Clostridia bacterium]|nr:DUF86 domain-containing protein [Clostridia bacterium]